MGLLLAFGPSAWGASIASPADGDPPNRSRRAPDRDHPGDGARSTSTVVAEGTFEGKVGHQASGSYEIEESEEGDLTLTFSEDFEVTKGPDLYVYLSPVQVGNLTSDNATGAGALRIDTLHSQGGKQDYDLKDTIELDDYDSVVIYCFEFSALFAGAELGTSIPVELTNFDGRATKSNARLTWQTASETNNAGFEVQRQKEKDWTPVGYVESKAPGGTTTETSSYSYTAEDLPVGTHQFRLKQVDLDGSSTLTDPVSVDIQMQEALRLTAPAPNPTSSNATLSFAVKEQAETTITLYSTLGQEVATVHKGTPQAGERQTAQVDVSSLPSGTYFVRLRADGQTRTRKVTVVR